MIDYLSPLDFCRIVMFDLAHPAFVRSDVAGSLSGIILASSVTVENSVANQRASMAEDSRSRYWRGLRPPVFFGVIHLDIVDHIAVRAAAHEVDVAIAINAGYRIAER